MTTSTSARYVWGEIAGKECMAALCEWLSPADRDLYDRDVRRFGDAVIEQRSDGVFYVPPLRWPKEFMDKGQGAKDERGQ